MLLGETVGVVVMDGVSDSVGVSLGVNDTVLVTVDDHEVDGVGDLEDDREDVTVMECETVAVLLTVDDSDCVTVGD